MKIGLQFEKENLARLAVAMVFATVLCVNIGFSVIALLGFAVAYFLVKSIRLDWNEKYHLIGCIVCFALNAFFTTHQVQYLLLEEELRVKTSDEKLWLNIICVLAITVVIQLFANHVGRACIISHIFFMLLAGVNYFVYLFRGNEFIFSDLKSAQTGLSVAGNYEFVLDVRAGYVILISTVYVALLRKVKIVFEKKKLLYVVGGSLAVFCIVYVGEKSRSIVTETWEQKGSYRNGYILNFVLSIRDSYVGEPEGYSLDAVAELEAAYSKKDELAAEEKPTVIVVMSESYADLSVIGNFETNMELTPFFDSLTENTTKGYALASVFGAKTPNSEWEFMTGNSMAYLPSGSVVYQQYISDTPTSLVSNLKNQGYTCVAMHPYYETGWSRNIVYPNLGFDESYFIDDFDQSKMVREYISDRELYETIIERFESKAKNEDLFIMSISMQNHGGYTEKYDNFDEQARMLGINYPDVNQYLSLVHESDLALEYLISYFKKVEEPVEIVFFGDHQPSLSSSFYPYLNGKGLSGLTTEELQELYTVPFFIWTNYESEEETVELTSLNFLSSLALEKSGLDMPPYNQFLLELRDVVPAMNARGYYSKIQEEFVHFEDATGAEAKWLLDYEILQYNNMFDKNEKSTVFFPYLTEDTK